MALIDLIQSAYSGAQAARNFTISASGMVWTLRVFTNSRRFSSFSMSQAMLRRASFSPDRLQMIFWSFSGIVSHFFLFQKVEKEAPNQPPGITVPDLAYLSILKACRSP